jgi:TonB family protein
MRKLFIASIIFAALSCAAAVAQDKATVRWHRVIPETEAFAVLMPEPPLRVRRLVPFSDKLKVTTPVYEVGHRGILFSVLSIDKDEVDALKTFDDFESGLRYAVKHSSRAKNSEITFERKVTLNEQTARQYLMRAEGKEGTAQVYETRTHYYVLMTLGARFDELMASNFFNSFSLDPKRAREASDKVSVIQDFSRPSPSAPESLWSLAESASPLIGPVGPVGSVGANAPAAPTANATPQATDPNAINGGVLNGKATKKPQPVYPPIAMAARAQGTVVVQITVDEEGYVISARAVSGHPLLQQAAVQAARQARFTPTRLEGKPVKVLGVITYNFVLAADPSEPPTRKY